MHTLNFGAIVGAALSTFVIGGLWYSPLLFHRAWANANGWRSTEQNPSGRVRTFVWAFIFALVMATTLSAFLNGPGTTVLWGAAAGALSALWVALAMATTGMFEQRSTAHIAINAGYWVVSFVVMGTILAAWR